MLSIVYSFYDPTVDDFKYPIDDFLNIHINNWRSYPIDLLKQIKIIIVDDGSLNPIKLDIDFPINLVHARINENIYWNISGATNLGHKLADNDWVFSLDGDHLLSPDECKKAIELKKEKNNVYMLERVKPEQLLKNIKPSPNSFLIHNEDYWKIGGYDESMTGNGGYNDLMFFTLVNNTKVNINNLPIKLILWDNFITTGKGGKKGREVNGKKVQDKIKEIELGKYVHPKNFNFTWDIIKEYKI